ncbi:MAG: hypothetical protein ACOYX1_03590 [Acidobacteriota bacterium]
MSIFDGQVKVGTRISLEGDDFAPNMGALVGSSYTEDVMNHGTLNQLVQGNVIRTFLANETISILANQTVSIMGNQTLTLTGNCTETINGNCTKTILGMLTESLIAGQNTVCVGPFNRTDIAPSTWLCPSSSQFNSGSWMECKMHKISAAGLRLTLLGLDTTIRQTNVDVTINKVKTDAICTKIKNIESKAIAGAKMVLAAAMIGTAAAVSNVSGVDAEVRAARPAVGVELSVPPSSMPGVQ